MNTFTQSAQGAAHYSRSDYHPSPHLDEKGLFGPEAEGAVGGRWSVVIDDLLRIRTLQDDWDGEGAEAPRPALVDSAISVAQQFQAGGYAPPDRVYAGVNATIYFEWHTPLEYREVEFFSPVDAERRVVRRGANTADVVPLFSPM